MEHHEGLANALKLEVHDSREGSTHQLSCQLTHLQTKSSISYLLTVQGKVITRKHHFWGSYCSSKSYTVEAFCAKETCAAGS